MSTLRSRSLYISHSWTYGDAYKKLTALLDAAPDFRYKSYFVPKKDPAHEAVDIQTLYCAIQSQIVYCDVALIMAGKDATYGKWIQCEIQIAKKDYNRPIVVIRPWVNKLVSSVILDAADQIVGWNTSSIVSAIRGLDP